MGKPTQANKRMFYRLLNHLEIKRKTGNYQISNEYILILDKIASKKNPQLRGFINGNKIQEKND